MRIPHTKRRMTYRRDTTDQRKLLRIMQELEPGMTNRKAAEAYRVVTQAVNGWIVAHTKDMPKGIHSRLLVADCFSVNVCWMRGVPGKYPPWPTVWIGLPGKVRSSIHKQRCSEWHAWKARGMQ